MADETRPGYVQIHLLPWLGINARISKVRYTPFEQSLRITYGMLFHSPCGLSKSYSQEHDTKRHGIVGYTIPGNGLGDACGE
jgi:hypothetical protein